MKKYDESNKKILPKIPKKFLEQWQKKIEQNYDFHFHEISAFSDLENVNNSDSLQFGDCMKSKP